MDRRTVPTRRASDTVLGVCTDDEIAAAMDATWCAECGDERSAYGCTPSQCKRPCPDCDGEKGEEVEGRFGLTWVPCPTCQPPESEWWSIWEGEK